MIINSERQKIEELNVFIYILYPLNIGLRYKKKKSFVKITATGGTEL